MKRIVFSITLLTVLAVISFAGTSKGDPNYKHQNGVGTKGFHKAHHIIHPVDHFTI